MISKYAEAFTRLFYPAECAICHTMLTLDEKILCSRCSEDLDTLAWPFEKTLLEEQFEFLDHVWTVFAYVSPLKELLHGVKYGHRDYLLKPCQNPFIALAQAVTSAHDYSAILPIPIHTLKRIQRHFNQTELLARILAPQVTTPIKTSLLTKKHALPSQTYLDRAERKINVYGAFKVKKPEKIRNKSFLLIDDVFTTGSTANEAARTLKLHGARRVDLLTLARTITEKDKIFSQKDLPERSLDRNIR